MRTSGEAVLLIGPLPPPIGGQSMLNKAILESAIANNHPLIAFDVGHKSMGKPWRPVLTLTFCIRLLWLLIKQPSIRLLHIQTQAGMGFFEKSLFVLLGKAFGRKSVLHIHGGRFPQFWNSSGRLRKHLIRLILDLNDAIIVLAESWKRFYETEVRCRACVVVLPNAVKVSCANPPLRMTDSATSFLFVGHLKPEKGLLDLLEALLLLVSDSVQVELRLMGEGDTAENERIIREAYGRNKLHVSRFLGPMEGQAKWDEFSAADVFILPSHSEDMPLSILEAMALGKPVIVTRVGSIPEIIDDGINGFIVPPRNPAALAEKMRVLAQNPELCCAMAKANRLKVQENYEFSVYERRLEGLYHCIVGQRYKQQVWK